MQQGTQRSNPTVKATRGFPPNFKQRRLEQWDLLLPSWMEYIQEDNFHNIVHQEVKKAVLEHLDRVRTPHPSLIDLGCGHGHFLNWVIKVQTEGEERVNWSRLVGLDFCARAVDLAKNGNPYNLPRIACFRADLELPLETRTVYPLRDFSVATASFLFDEVEDLSACFASAASVLIRGGHLVAALLDTDRERERYRQEVESVGAGDGPVLLAKSLEVHGRTAAGEFFRALRGADEIQGAALAKGFEQVSSRVMTPSALRSRPDGPALRLFVWRKGE
jgi:SAM-dependent methyltransferase